MKKITFFLIIILIQTLNLKAEDFKLNKIVSGLDTPWSLTFKNQNEILVTEKSGQIILVNLKSSAFRLKVCTKIIIKNEIIFFILPK